MSISRAQAERRCHARRAAAYAHALEALADDVPVPLSLRPIEPSALDHAARIWTRHPERIVRWPWNEIAVDFRRDHPDRFEVAIWSGAVLCGLAIGRCSRSPLYCGVNYLEGSPDPAHALRGFVIGIVLAAAESYAMMLGKEEVRLFDPFPALVPIYEAFGYALATPRRASTYCWRRI